MMAVVTESISVIVVSEFSLKKKGNVRKTY